jgi:nitronate monooxygenase
VLAERPFAVSISFGDPAPYVARAHAADTRVVSQVQSAELARRAVAAGVDALVAQGTEAGGHTGSVGTLPLLQIVLEMGDAAGIPVIAAGGIASGRGVAGVLAMGAAGVWLGTRFVASAEAQGQDGVKQAIVGADETRTVHTHVFDIVQQLPWPDPFPGRALRNEFTERWHGREAELQARVEEVRPQFEAARGRGDLSQAFVYAGQAAGMVHEVLPAAAIVERLMADAEATLTRTSSVVQARARP